MKMSANTILITGGTSGIGFELAARLLKLGNRTIVTGRDQRKLDDAQRKLSGIYAFQSDVSDPKEIPLFYDTVVTTLPELNVLINNAGIVRKMNLQGTASSLEDFSREIETNLIGPIRSVRQFLPLLKAQKTAAIVIVSSVLAFVPFPLFPIYCAAKAGLHSFTQSLRVQIKDTGIKMVELAPPLTQTPVLAKDFQVEDLMGVRAMDVAKMVDRAIRGLEGDQLEIRPGLSNLLKLMSRVAPQFILNRFSKPVEAMLAQAAQQ
jgi:uncharacterized oxidoreductase